MSDVTPASNNWNVKPEFPKLVAWVITFTVYGFAAVIFSRFISTFPSIWRNCIGAYPNSNVLDLASLTAQDSLRIVLHGYAVMPFDIYSWSSGLAMAAYGTKYGRPPIAVPVGAWILASVLIQPALIWFMGGELSLEKIYAEWPHYLFDLVISIACWFFSRRLW